MDIINNAINEYKNKDNVLINSKNYDLEDDVKNYFIKYMNSTGDDII